MKYQVTIIETIRHTIEVSAKNEESAIEKAEKMFENNPGHFDSEQDWESPEIEEIK